MSLLFPLYFLGLLALLLPWMLHRFSHHEPPEQAFPTTRFLEPTKPPATSKRKLRHLPLLLLRILFLALLCFLFAQPWLTAQNDAANSEGVHLVVVDNSFSMRAGKRWEQAQDALDTALDAVPNNDAVQLFSFANQLRAQSEIVNDRQQLENRLSTIEPSYESADFGELMRYLNKVAGDIDKPVSATFITDGQRANLPVQTNALLANRLEQFTVVAIDSTAPVNYSLRAQARTSDMVNARVNVRVAASDSADESAIAAVLKTVQVSVNDRIVATNAIEINAGETKTIQFDNIALPSQADALFSVSFAESDFLVDDDKVVIPVLGLSSVELSMAHAGTEPDEQAQVFVKTALETNGDANVEILDLNTALAPTIRHAVVFVDDVTSIPDNVREFVIAGGNVLLLPSQVRTAVSDSIAVSSAASSITRIDQVHPLGLGDIDWFSAGFYSTASIELENDDQVLLGLDTGEPLLVERNLIDAGRILILNDVLDGLMSDLPLQPSFVLLIQNIIQYFDASNALPIELEVGNTLALPANSQVLTPAGDAMLELSQLGSSNGVQLLQPGVYTVLGTSSAATVTAVISAAESNLFGLSREELDAWEARNDREQQNNEQEKENEQGVNTRIDLANDQIDKQTLWRWLLPVVLLFLLMESVLANRMLWVRRDGL